MYASVMISELEKLIEKHGNLMVVEEKHLDNAALTVITCKKTKSGRTQVRDNVIHEPGTKLEKVIKVY